MGEGRLPELGGVGWGELPVAARVVTHEDFLAVPADSTVHLKWEKKYNGNGYRAALYRYHPSGSLT